MDDGMGTNYVEHDQAELCKRAPLAILFEKILKKVFKKTT